MRGGLRVMLVVLLLTPGLVSCRWFRKPPRPIPPPFRPPVQTDSAQAKPAEPPEPAPAPALPPSEEAEPQVMIPETSQGRLPPPPKPRIPVSQPVQQPAAQATPPPPEAAPAPQLRPILTPSQTQELERTITDRLSRAQGILKSIEGRRRSRTQYAAARQIQTFIDQAEEARKTDLLRASNLAERAEVLAQDLAQQMR